MADAYRLSGSAETQPLVGSPSMVSSISAVLDEQIQLAQKDAARQVFLNADGPISVPLPTGITGVNVLHLKIISGSSVVARLTSASGTTQSWPVDPLVILHTLTMPVTAIDLTRVAGVDTVVEIFLGQKA